MGKLINRSKLNALANVFLALVVTLVAAVCFYPRAERTSELRPYYSGKTDGNRVSLMFNVYEGERQVDEILAILKERNLTATFFIGGCYADDRTEMLVRIAAAGCELGSHGYFHLDHAAIGYDRNVEEIEASVNLIRAATGTDPALFAPPSGSYSQDTMRAAEKLGLAVVMWTKDTIDWRADATKEKIISRATEGVKGGDLILMHPKENTVAALPEILDFYEKKGLFQSTVSENLFGETFGAE